MTKVLITGATGFVGRYLSNVLFENGYEIFPVVRRSEDSFGFIKAENHRHISVMNADTDWSEALLGIDVVINLAARAHVMHEESSNPLEDYREVNVLGLENLAKQAVLANVKQIIHLSSIKVNGEETFDLPYNEDSKTNPEDPYGISKLEGERVLRRIGSSQNIMTTIIRPPLIYGPNVKGNLHLLSRLILKGLPLPFALANNRRSMVSLYNLCDCIQTCILNNQAYEQTFLVSDGEAISTADLMRYLAMALNKRTYLIPIPIICLRLILALLGKGNISRRLFSNLEIDSSATQKHLNWVPPLSVENSFKKIFEES